MKNILLLATVALAFASCSKSDDDNNLPSSDYKLSADGLTLVQWTNSTTTTLDMQADSKLQKVNTIGNNAFESNQSLVSITFPNNLKEIGAHAFEKASLSGTVTFNTMATVAFGEEAFHFSDIRKVALPNTKEIAKGMFSFCHLLKEVHFQKVGKIDKSAFHSCFALEQVDLQATELTEIGETAFASCRELKSITFPETLSKIGDLAFGYCSSLKTITIKAKVPPALGDTIFFGLNRGDIPNIYVPGTAVDTYKKANGWSTFADKIYPIP